MIDACLRHTIMSSSCVVDDPTTSEGALILASVAMASESNVVNDVSDKGLQLHLSGEPKQGQYLSDASHDHNFIILPSQIQELT